MIKQIIVINKSGMCVLDRSYDTTSVDPHLISAFISAVIVQAENFGDAMNFLHTEVSQDNNSFIEILMQNDWTIVAFASTDINRSTLKNSLNDIAGIVAQKFQNNDESVDLLISEINQLEEEIDITIAQKGLSASSRSGNDSGILPIIQRVQNGEMHPKKAAELLIKWVNNKYIDQESKRNFLKSLEYLDSLLSTQSNKLDDLLIIIRATYKGVSKTIVKLDDAMSF